MKFWEIDKFIEQQLILGEGAVWSSGEDSFFCVDIDQDLVLKVNPYDDYVQSRTLQHKPSTVVPSADGRLLIALKGEIGLLSFDSGNFEQLAEVEPEKVLNRSNDGKCDADGRFWFGTMQLNAEQEKGSFYKFDGSIKKMVEKASIPNGVCWSADNKILYHVDSLKKEVVAYAYDLANGTIDKGRVIIEIADSYLPDGMAIDDDGMLWIAMWDGFAVNRYDPVSGRLIGQIKLPVPRITSCAFGGNGFSLLMVTSARAGLSAQELEKYPLSGGLFFIETGVKGRNSFLYK